jgi:hypothetical protein
LEFYRVFDWDGISRGSQLGGPLYVPRARQGSGRHDIPQEDGVLYTSLSATSAVAEAIQFYRNEILDDRDFEIHEDMHQALFHIKAISRLHLADLTDPQELVRRAITPTQVATHDRSMTQRLALELYQEGLDGFLWWSTLEASWTNATLFQSRAIKKLRLVQKSKRLTTKLPELMEAARFLNIRLKLIRKGKRR